MTEEVNSARSRLARWGYDEHFHELYQELAVPGDRVGRVLRADQRSCVVADVSGEASQPIAQALLSEGGARPTTGDWVVVVPAEGIRHVLERRTSVVRASADPGRGPQVLAANVDTVIVAEPLGERWRPRRLERLLVVAWQSGAIPLVVLTKADRCDDIPGALAAAAGLAPGASVLAVSALEGEGIDEIGAELAPGTTAVVLGRSGAGKSTLANALSGGLAGLDTGPIRSDGKGRHTTVTRELVELTNGALLIDTPGIRAIGLIDSTEAINDAFNDIDELAAQCRFNDCAHGKEPGCAVTAAIADGSLDAARLESYERLLREQARQEAKTDPKLRAQRAAEMRRFYKAIRDQPVR